MTKRKPPEQLLPLMSVAVRGTVYPSVQAACEALSVSDSNLRAMLSRGKIDRVGIGYKGHRRGNAPPPVPAKSIAVCGRTFATLSSLSLFLGRSRSYVSQVLNNNPDGLERIKDEYLQVLMKQAAKVEMKARKDVENRIIRTSA